MTERLFRRVCVFCGSSSGVRPEYAAQTKSFATLLAKAGMAVVYGGGRVGLMGVLADATLAAGGEAIGVMPQALVDKEISHTGLTHLHVVDSMHARKALMADLADAFVLLPGGFGSWEEFSEVVTWAQLGIHRKPCGVLNIRGYYDHLFSLAAHAVKEGFLRAAHDEMVVVDEDPGRLLSKLKEAPLTTVVKWIDTSER